MIRRLLPALLVLLGLPAIAAALPNGSAQGWCETGASNVLTAGLTSTTQVQLSLPSCTVQVFVHGGGSAAIYSDGAGTALANPFVAQTNGHWQFYAANGRYDVTMSGAGFPNPVTYSDVFIVDVLFAPVGPHLFLGNNTSSAIPPTFSQVGFTDLAGSLACSQTAALTGPITSPAGSCATVAAFLGFNNAFTGTNYFYATTMGSFNKIIAVDGIQYTTLGAALSACPSIGCTVWVPDGVNPTIASVLTITNPIHLIFGKNTLTCTMSDPGTTSGCIVIASDNVEIEGQGALSLITQPAAQNIQTLMYLGTQGNIRIHGLKFNDNDNLQTNLGFYFTSIRSAGGSHDIRIYDNEFTRAGNRAIDLRGTNHSWIERNWFHDTGIGVAGNPLTSFPQGNSVSVDVDGTTQSQQCFLEYNLIEKQGDAFACGHAIGVHMNHNTIRGPADFGQTGTSAEAGLDVGGSVDVEVIGNVVINVRGPQLYMGSTNVAGVNYLNRNVRVEGNTFIANTTCCGLPASDPRIVLGNTAGGGITSGQQMNIGFINNTLDGVRVNSETVANLQVEGNGFHNINSSIAGGIAFSLDQVNGTGAVTKNFAIRGNSFSTDNSTLITAVNLVSTITTPDSCDLSGNTISTGVTSGIFANGGFAIGACYVQSGKTIGKYDNASTPIANTFPTPLTFNRWKTSGTTHVPGDWVLGGNWGTSPPAVTINNSGNDDAFSITVTAGTGSPGASPTVTLTFHDGTRTNNPQCWGNRADLSSPLPAAAPWVRTNVTPTTVTFTFTGTPVASAGYSLEGGCIGH